MCFHDRLVLLAAAFAGLADNTVTILTLTLVNPDFRARTLFSKWAD